MKDSFHREYSIKRKRKANGKLESLVKKDAFITVTSGY